jgi:NADH-quinone oxidoreductase subunit E
MAVRRLAEQQPEAFALTPENQAWAERKIRDYPEGRQASAVIPILWKVQEQEGWVPEPAIRLVADMLAMPYIRVFEVATFYTMFQLKPVGSVAHIGVCGTTPCMLRGAPELVSICRKRIADHPFDLSADGRFSWEEVECAGACVNAPMVQIGADTYEDLTPESFNALLDALDRGSPPAPGPQSARRASEPITGPTTLTSPRKDVHPTAPEAPPEPTPDANVDPRSPAAADQDHGRPSSQRAEVEATRTTNAAPAEAHPVAPEPKTNGQIASGPDAPEKQQSANTAGDQPTGEPAPPTAEQAEAADRIVTEGPAKIGTGDAVETRDPSLDSADKAQADRAAPAADLAQSPAPAGETPAPAASETPARAASETPAPAASEAPAPAASETPAPAASEAPAPAASEAPAPAASATSAPTASEAPASAAGEAPAAREAGGEAPAPAASGEAPARAAGADGVQQARKPKTGAAAEPSGTRPPVRERGEGGEPDDLTKISGIGRKTAETLNSLGIWRYDHIAAWGAPELEWISGFLAVKGRIDPRSWVAQAKKLAGNQGA